MPDYIKPVLSLFFVVIASGAIGGIMAANRGRNVAAWCVLCALLPPLLLFLYVAGPLCEVEGKFRKCPMCGVLIRWHAAKCKQCASGHSMEGRLQ